ncbi:MAG: sigma-70 family RNA polymerase sigma factor [Bryobacteraceae bacterium]
MNELFAMPRHAVPVTTSTGLPAAAPDSMAGAFEAEAMPHLNDVFRVAMRMTKDHAKANDAVQETYLLAWKCFHRYERGTNCRAWLFQILFNVVRHERRNWFKWLTGTESDVSDSVELVAPVPVPDTLEDKQILAALDLIPEQFRAVLLLVDVEDFTYKEASEILKVPIGTIMSRLNRARGLLRGRLAGLARSYGLRAEC